MSWFGNFLDLFSKKKLDASTLEELEDLLLCADLGPETSKNIINNLSAIKTDKDISKEEIKEILSNEIANVINNSASCVNVKTTPHVIMMVGVNGNGKTTSAGKLACKFKQQGKKVLLAAADTFRASAVEQLKIWANNAQVEFFCGSHNQDPAAVAYLATEKAKKESFDIVIIDTAGRLQNKSNLMAELTKIQNTCKKNIPEAPQDILLVIDATTGQNAIKQVEEFSKATKLTGLIITKLDGTAKGGVLVAIAQKFEIKIYYTGYGEGIEDLEQFQPSKYITKLLFTN